MASLSRARKIPKLASLLKGGARARQTPEQQRSILLDIAAILGLRVERHEFPVI